MEGKVQKRGSKKGSKKQGAKKKKGGVKKKKTWSDLELDQSLMAYSKMLEFIPQNTGRKLAQEKRYAIMGEHSLRRCESDFEEVEPAEQEDEGLCQLLEKYLNLKKPCFEIVTDYAQLEFNKSREHWRRIRPHVVPIPPEYRAIMTQKELATIVNPITQQLYD